MADQRLTGRRNSARIRAERTDIFADGDYSAAIANLDFGFAAEIMKSLMRGMISERKREPLNTP